MADFDPKIYEQIAEQLGEAVTDLLGPSFFGLNVGKPIEKDFTDRMQAIGIVVGTVVGFLATHERQTLALESIAESLRVIAEPHAAPPTMPDWPRGR